MNPDDKAWIDSASYESLLDRWRNAPIGSRWFIGDLGTYLAAVLARKREEVGNAEHVRASKNIGW